MFPRKEDGLEIFIEALTGGSTDSAIRNQKKRGQSMLVNSEVLPKKINSGTREQFEQMGIVFGEDADDLFVYVTLPEGWKKQPTDHDMWSKLVDERGRERASIFYKAAFYDRGAHLNITRRFSYSYRPALGYDHPDHRKGGWVGVVTDCDNVIWQTAELEPEPEYQADREAWLVWCDKRGKLTQEARRWLEANYPEWESPLAYWEAA